MWEHHKEIKIIKEEIEILKMKIITESFSLEDSTVDFNRQKTESVI